MAAIVTNKFRVYAAQKFIAGLGDTTTNNIVYLFMGKTLPWTTADGVGATDTTPPFPLDTVQAHIVDWQDMIHLKRISASNATLVILRKDWVLGVIYQEYTHDIDLFDPTLGLQAFYVMTDELNVYKCLYNNNGNPSFVKPTGTSTNIIATSDHYQWKYMFTVSTALAQKFLTTEWIPVKTLVVSDGSVQFDVQQAAIPGSIDVIKVINGGFGYISPPALTITGDGTGATALTEISNGQIQDIIITNRGKGYTTATATPVSGQVTAINITSGGTAYVSPPGVTLTGGGGSGATATCTVLNGSVNTITIVTPGSGYTSAPTVGFSAGNATAVAIISGGVVLKPIISPPGGHGSDPVSELGGFFAMIDGQFAFNEGNFNVVNDFRRIGLVLNPFKWNTNTVAVATTASQSYSLKFSLTTGSSFSTDEQVFGQTSGAIGYTLDYDVTNSILRVVNVSGIFQPGETVANAGATKTGLLRASQGTAQSGGAFQITLAVGDTTATNGYAGFTLRITGGTGVGQQKIIVSNILGTSNVVTVDKAWVTTPDGTSTYAIANIKYPDLQPDTGYIMYVENRRPITRAATQLEDIKVVAEF